MSKSYRKFMATSLSAALVVSAVGTVSAANFSDTEGKTGAEQIDRLVNAGVLKGYPDGSFKPGNAVERRHAAVYFTNSLQLKIADSEIAQYLAGFSDVNVGDNYAKEIAAAVKAGIFNGNPVGGKFNPTSPMTRQHMAVTTVNALGLTKGEGEVNLTDLDSVNPNYREAVEILVSNGIVKGDNGKFNPNANVTRGQLAVFLVSSMDTAGVALPEAPKEDPKEAGELSVTTTWTQSQSVASTQSLFEVGTVTLKAGSNDDVVVNGIDVTRSGLSADTDIRGISVWDGTKRLNLPVIIANGKAEIGFTSPLKIDKGTSKTLSIKVDFNVAQAGSQMIFSLANANAIKSSAKATTGTFPTTSGTYTASQVNLGTLTVTRAAIAPTRNVDPNTKDVTVAAFRVTAANEAVALKRVAFSQNGSASAEDVENFKVFVEGKQVGSATKMDGRTVTVTFNNDVKISNGGFVDLVLKADIKAGSGRSLQFGINDAVDIEGRGETYGTAITGRGSATPVQGSANQLTINAGSLLVARDASSPAAGNISSTVMQQSFGAFKVEAIGEPIQLRTINLTAVSGGAGAVTDLRNVKVMVGNQVVFTSANPFATNPTGAVTLSNPITIKPGEPVVLKVVADLNAAPANANYRVDLTANGIRSVGTVSGDTITSTNPTITTNNLTVGNLSVTAGLAPAPGNGSIFANETDRHIMSINLGHNLSEAVEVSQLNVLLATNNGDVRNITNLRLVDADGNVLSNVIPTGGADNVFTLTNPITVEKSENKQVRLVGNIGSGVTNTHEYYFGLGADNQNSVARTKSTGTAVTVNGFAADAANGRTLTVSTAAPTLTVSSVTSLGLSNAHVVRGTKDAVIGSFRIRETANVQGAYITDIIVTPTLTGLATAHLSNIRVVDASNDEVLGTIPNFTASGATHEIELTKEIYVKNSTKDIKILADVAATATNNGTVQLELGDGAGAGEELAYREAATGVTGVHNQGAQVASITTRAVPTKVTVEKVAVPSTLVKVGDLAGAEVAKFKITNDGPESIRLDNLTLTATGFDAAAAVTLFNAETGATLSNPVSNLGAATAFDTTNEGLGSNADGTGIALNPGKSIVIAARITTTTNLAAGNTLNLRLDATGTTYVLNGIGTIGDAADQINLIPSDVGLDTVFVRAD